MFKKITTAVLLCGVILLSMCSFAPIKAENKAEAPAVFETEKVLQARFLNMLNHSFVYDDAFYDDEALLNASSLALLDYQTDGFISDSVIKDYVFNMYGKSYDDLSVYNKNFPKADGKFFVVPRGYDIYKHSILNVTENEDGSFTVITEVEIDYHFNETVTAVCETLFIENELSQFGYNILYSDITETPAATLSI